MTRFQIINESRSEHCCFDYTIVDTSKPDISGGKQYVYTDWQGVKQLSWKTVCECFDYDEAKLVADALNSVHTV